MPSILEQYRIADFLEWHKERKLVLNPHFQRGSVWTATARVYLIDTILRQLPIPKIYLRTLIDINSRRSVREVVDGQQRLRAIIDFSENKFPLTKRAGEFQGLRFIDMNSELQERFISYPLAVDQLINADDEQVLEVFSRLNSYSVSLNGPEKRHAKFQGDFKWAVRASSQKWAILWEKYMIFTIRERVRMEDDSLMAEMYGVLLNGILDGGQPKIDSLYKQYDDSFETGPEISERVDQVLQYIMKHFADYLIHTPILSAPHLLMLFAALAHSMCGIPNGKIGKVMPERNKTALNNVEIARNNLLQLAAVIQSPEPTTDKFKEFWSASKSSTHRIASREKRFPIFFKALLPQVL